MAVLPARAVSRRQNCSPPHGSTRRDRLAAPPIASVCPAFDRSASPTTCRICQEWLLPAPRAAGLAAQNRRWLAAAGVHTLVARSHQPTPASAVAVARNRPAPVGLYGEKLLASLLGSCIGGVHTGCHTQPRPALDDQGGQMRQSARGR